MLCRVFDDTTTQSVLVNVYVPAYATTVTIGWYGIPKTGVASKEVDFLINYRLLGNGAPGSWSTEKKLGSLAADGSMNTSENVIALSTLGLTAGNYYQIMLSRDIVTATGTGTNLVGNYQLVNWRLKFK